jgi:hypothetical protein
MSESLAMSGPPAGRLLWKAICGNIRDREKTKLCAHGELLSHSQLSLEAYNFYGQARPLETPVSKSLTSQLSVDKKQEDDDDEAAGQQP